MAGPSEYQVALLIAVGTVGMLLLAIAIILFMVFYQKKMIQEQYNRQKLELEYQQKMMEAALESQEAERKRVAGDLHDSVGGMLSAVRVGLTTIARQLPDPMYLEEQKKMLDDTIANVRMISRDLMPSTLERFGLTHALKELCDRFQTTSLLPVTFTEEGDFEALSPRTQLMLFRIAQELVSNAVKHAQANQIAVALLRSDQLEMIIEDDGIGFDADEKRQSRKNGSGLGLFNIENRIRLLNGKVEFEKGRDRGSKITITMPL
jgi:two-component system, NarL family, sensor kinase